MRVTVDGDGVVIQIADTGIGIPADAIDRAMEPFRQVDSKLARKYEGSGLGLPLARSLARAHGGDLTLESEFGSGTTVTVRFPADRTHPVRATA